jgi:hypothetical protein
LGIFDYMKRARLLFVISFLVIHFVQAQEIVNNRALSLYFGPSFPIGHFADKNPSNNLSGYARPGESAVISFDQPFYKHLGLVAEIYGERNGLNTTVLANQFAGTWFFNGLGSGYPRQYPNWTIDKKSWYLESALLGLCQEFSLRKNSKISLMAKAMIGIALGQSPELDAKSESDSSYTTITQNGASAVGFSYSVSGSIKYRLNPKIHLLLQAAYFATANLDFKNVTETIISTNGGLNVPKTYSFSNSVMPPILALSTGPSKQPISTINVLIGIGLTL